ncbi:MAG: LptF/LptG family permease [Chitinophagales bacterium]|nr:LptF/LptG family permease [Chitinophagales bacterium]MDW8273350.1 LptF/LptG family permease [Chitinophagales bacterium]
MKKIDKLVIGQFIGPFVLTFGIALFVLVMQFLWKYIDDLVGKGISTWVLAELLFYASAKLVPLALPLAALLASIMTMGSFGEHLEITAAKAAGISLLRFMQPLFFASICIAVLALLFSNYVLPVSNLKFSALLYDIRHLKPSLALKPGIFYNGIDGYSIRAEEKSKDGNTLYDIVLYDHTSGRGAEHIITAREGSLVQDDDKMVITLTLKHGKQYRELNPEKPDSNKFQMVRSSFITYEKKFDLSQFKLSRTDENYFKDLKQMLSLEQLMQQKDTMILEKQQTAEQLKEYLRPYYNYLKWKLDSTITNPETVSHIHFDSAFDAQNLQIRSAMLDYAINNARNIKNYTQITLNQLHFKDKAIAGVMIEIYRKFTLSVACIVLFLVGAPLGSIIRKGGLGWPLFYAVLFFILYHVSSMIGEKLSEREKLSVFAGMWFSTFLLLPIGIFLTLKATDDSQIFSIDFYKKILRIKR